MHEGYTKTYAHAVDITESPGSKLWKGKPPKFSLGAALNSCKFEAQRTIPTVLHLRK